MVLTSLHLLSALVISLFLSKKYKYLKIGLILGSWFPDLDIFLIDVLLIEHRSLTHSLFFAFSFFPFLKINFLFLGFGLGIILHSVEDLPTGYVKIFYPFNIKVGGDFVKHWILDSFEAVIIFIYLVGFLLFFLTFIFKKMKNKINLLIITFYSIFNFLALFIIKEIIIFTIASTPIISLIYKKTIYEINFTNYIKLKIRKIYKNFIFQIF